jgi:hypothetical protein
MALSKEIPFGNPLDGWTITYWRVVQITPDVERGEVAYTLAGYSSQAARRAGAEPRSTVTGTLRPEQVGIGSVWEVQPKHVYTHAKRPQDSVEVTAEIAAAHGYPEALVGQTVLQGVAGPLAGATDA